MATFTKGLLRVNVNSRTNKQFSCKFPVSSFLHLENTQEIVEYFVFLCHPDFSALGGGDYISALVTESPGHSCFVS